MPRASAPPAQAVTLLTPANCTPYSVIDHGDALPSPVIVAIPRATAVAAAPADANPANSVAATPTAAAPAAIAAIANPGIASVPAAAATPVATPAAAVLVDGQAQRAPCQEQSLAEKYRDPLHKFMSFQECPGGI